MSSTFKKYSLFAALITAITITGCKKDDEVAPHHEHEVEVFTDVKLIFTNTDDATDVVEARAKDPDGEGVEKMEILDEINLSIDKTYKLTFEILNALEDPAEDIGLEIAQEKDEHQFFFSFSNDAFTNPLGNGNIDNASDAINYNDVDGKGRPVGLITTWTTSSTQLSKGSFNVRLQHQHGVKTSTSGANDGDTDFELSFVLNIQ